MPSLYITSRADRFNVRKYMTYMRAKNTQRKEEWVLLALSVTARRGHFRGESGTAIT